MKTSIPSSFHADVAFGTHSGERGSGVATHNMADLISLREFSQRVKIPLPTVYVLAQREHLPCIRIGSRWRVNWKMVEERLATGWQPRIRRRQLNAYSPSRSESENIRAKLVNKPGDRNEMSSAVRYATLDPQWLGPHLTLTAIQICTRLQLVPVASDEQNALRVTVNRGLRVVFLGVDQLRSLDPEGELRTTCRDPRVVVVLLLPASYDRTQLLHLPAGMAIFISRAGTLHSTVAAISQMIEKLTPKTKARLLRESAP